MLPDLSPSLVGLLPSAVVGGAPGAVFVRITDAGPVNHRGPVDVSLFASVDDAVDDADPLLGTTRKNLRLRGGGGSKQFKVKFLFPSDLPDGAYRLIARVNAGVGGSGESDLSNNDAASAQAVTIAKPFADLALSDLAVPARNGALQAGRRAGASVLVTNQGNAPFTGPLSVAVSAVPSAGNPSDVIHPLATATKPVTIKPGAAKRLRLPFGVAAAIPPGPYTIRAAIQPAAAGDADPSDDATDAAGTVNIVA